MAQADQGRAMLHHGADWPGRAIAAERRVISLEEQLRGEREAYNSLSLNVESLHQAREEDLEETVEIFGEAYDQLINLIVLHEPLLREHYEERPDELPKEQFEKTMHELHVALVVRSLDSVDDVRAAIDVDAG